MERVGIRELRNNVSRVVARARAGERILITADGIPVAEIGPVRATGERMTMAELIAAGHVIPPRDTTRPPPPPKLTVPDGRTSMEILDELREAPILMLFLDTSALVKRYLNEDGREEVLALMERDQDWAASRLARTEADVTLCRLFNAGVDRTRAQTALATDWARFAGVAADERCMSRAAELGCALGLRTLDAIHLASTDQFGPGLRFVTFDRRLRAAATSLGIPVEPFA